MTATKPVPRKRETAADLAARTVVFEIRLNAPSFKRTMRSQDVVAADDDTDPSFLHIRKDLIDPDALAALGACKSKYLRWLWGKAVSCSMLRGGMTLIPLPFVNDVDVRTQEFKKERAELVRALVERYETLREEAKTRLGRHYKDEDYPAAEDLLRAFSVRTRFLSFNVPAALEDLNKDLYEREKKRVETEWAEAGAEIRQALRESFAGLVEHLAERLSVDAETGKPRTFKDSSVAQFQDFLATFAARDLTGDRELANLARKAQSLVNGVGADDLRKDKDVRSRVLEGTEEIKAALTKMEVVVKKGAARRIAVEGEV